MATPTSVRTPNPTPNPMVAALAGFAAFAFMLIVPTALRDGDTGWHLATGAWIVAHAAVPTTDPFSYTALGRPWVAHEWLSELAMYGAWAAGGWSGLIALFGVALAALFAIVARYLQRWLPTGAVVLALLVLAAAILPSLLARPHMLALPILAGWNVALLDAREAGCAPPLWLAAVMLLWANAHGSFVFGLALIGVFALEALIAAAPAQRRDTIVKWGAFGILSLVASLLTPSGLHGLLFPFYVSNLELLPYINEWQAVDFKHWSGFEIVLLGTLLVLFLRPTRIPPIRLILLLYVLHLTFQHIRQDIVLAVVGVLILAEPIGRAWLTKATLPHPPQPWRSASGFIAMLAVVAVALTGYRLTVPLVRDERAGVPVQALAHLPPELRNRPVFNEYGFGGALIFAGIRPYIDGRSDMYGDPFSIDYFKIAKGDAQRFARADAKWHFGWTLMPPRSALIRVLDADPHWRRLYADDTAVIHVRRAQQ